MSGFYGYLAGTLCASAGYTVFILLLVARHRRERRHYVEAKRAAADKYNALKSFLVNRTVRTGL
jgi:hypothetical protein